ncbi:MAG: class I SAM-dependent methyltransferase [Promethearchaeota archaeon]
MDKEIIFSKYKILGSNYHYRQINKKSLKEFNAYVFARYSLEIDLLKKIINESKKQVNRILDIGCGDGVLIYLIAKKLKKKTIRLFGIDSSEIAIEVAKKKIPLAKFKVANIYDLPFKENYFDIIISSDVIEHVSEANKMLSEIRRVGKNNSYIIIGTPIKYTEKPIDNNHYHEFFPDEYKRLLDNFFYGIKKSHRYPTIHF